MQWLLTILNSPVVLAAIGTLFILAVARMIISRQSSTRSTPTLTVPTQLTQPEDTNSVTTYPWFYFVGLLITVSESIVLGIYLHSIGTSISFGGYTLDFGYLMFVVAALHLFSDIREVKLDEIAGIFFIGLPTIQVSGIWLPVPRLLFRLELFSRNVIQLELPGEPKDIYRDDGQVPEGKVPPLRVIFANPPDETASKELETLARGISETDPLHKRSSNEVTWVVRFQIERVFDFLANTGSIPSAKQQLDDLGSSLINTEFAQMTLAMAQKALTLVSNKLEQQVRSETRDWGVGIRTVHVKQIVTSHSLNSAIQEIPMATARAQATVQQAIGEKEKRKLEGEGDRDALAARASSGLTPELILKAQTGEKVASALANGKGENTKILLGASNTMADVFGIIEAVKDSTSKT